jgi:hypothetical protein
VRVSRRAGQGKDNPVPAARVAVVVAPWQDCQEQQPRTAGPHYFANAVGTEFVVQYVFHGTPFHFIDAAAN